MAKQVGIHGFVGKLGRSVGFTNSNAKVSGTVYERTMPAKVSNPRTYKQAEQRAKARPAILFYNAFIEVLNHAFIPAGRESKNRLRFQSLAMKLGVPNVYKDENRLPFNLPYQVSEGTLGLSALCKNGMGSTSAEAGHLYFPNFKAPAGWNDDPADIHEMTIAAFSAAVIAANPQLVDGEEITYMGILVRDDDPSDMLAAHFSIVLNTGDTLTTVADVMGSQLELIANAADTQTIGKFGICSFITGYTLVAGAMIISSRTASSWQYTNSFMGLTAYGLDGFDWDEQSVVESYMNSSSDVTSSRVLQQANNRQQQGVRPVSGELVAYTVSPAVTGATYNHAQAAVVNMSDGSRRVVVDAAGTLQYYADGTFTPITQTIDTVASPLNINATSWADVPTATEQEAADVPFGE